MSVARELIEVVARALADRPDEVRVVESEYKNTILVEFADGARFYTCRYYVRAV